jgi:hypothetical protein
MILAIILLLLLLSLLLLIKLPYSRVVDDGPNKANNTTVA